MRKYQRLNEQSLKEIAQLKQNGASNAFIGKFCEQYYGVARSTAYRYISENKEWYERQHRERLLARIQHDMCQGLTSREIADSMHQPLTYINKLIIQNGITCFNCK